MLPADAHADGVDPAAEMTTLARARDCTLAPELDIRTVMAAFDGALLDELAVVGEAGCVLGTLSDKFVRKRYADELEKAQRELFREP